ncbi:hypothetical protein F5884DRAFT_734839 [Xylogone sp. PMI_703]|nr:hypothetical protein F5884DRAFT_734839 [Xylogone sp. PMI_703]
MSLPFSNYEPQLPASSSPNLLRLPLEIVTSIVSYLCNSDIKSLRLTYKFLCERAPLRLDRLFLSVDPRNIEVCRAIANHEKLRHGIVEIIWDDAQLSNEIPRQNEQIYSLMDTPQLEGWFERACKKSIRVRNFTLTDHSYSQGDAAFSHAESWNYYQKLLLQQNDVFASGADVDALRYALNRFPLLRKVSITATAHGFLNAPLYETPMIRSFPRGFNYPIPPGKEPMARLLHYHARTREEERLSHLGTYSRCEPALDRIELSDL